MRRFATVGTAIIGCITGSLAIVFFLMIVLQVLNGTWLLAVLALACVSAVTLSASYELDKP
jgi:hypothetical protein